ncbi:DNA-binding protein [Streptococcus agalactiae]
MTEGFTIQLPKVTEKKLLARYDDMLQKAIEKAFEDKELYKPIVRMAGLCRWLDVSTTTVVKWQKQGGMPHMVIDGVTLYDKHKVAQWLQQFER